MSPEHAKVESTRVLDPKLKNETARNISLAAFAVALISYCNTYLDSFIVHSSQVTPKLSSATESVEHKVRCTKQHIKLPGTVRHINPSNRCYRFCVSLMYEAYNSLIYLALSHGVLQRVVRRFGVSATASPSFKIVFSISTI